MQVDPEPGLERSRQDELICPPARVYDSIDDNARGFVPEGERFIEKSDKTYTDEIKSSLLSSRYTRDSLFNQVYRAAISFKEIAELAVTKRYQHLTPGCTSLMT